jgi:hypothetical protein
MSSDVTKIRMQNSSRRIDDLRPFEREYRSRLKPYLEEHTTNHT